MYVKYFCSLNQTYKKAAGNWIEKNEHITSLKIYCTVYYADFSQDKFKNKSSRARESRLELLLLQAVRECKSNLLFWESLT